MAEPAYLSLLEFRYQIRRFLNFSEVAARTRGLEPQQHQALLVIRGHSPIGAASAGDLSRRLMIRHHSAVELVDRLERRGLVRRRPNPADRRSVLLSLTAKGASILRELSLDHRGELRTRAPALLRSLRAILKEGGRNAKRKGR